MGILNIFKRDTPDLPVYPNEVLDPDYDDGTIVKNVDTLGKAVIGHKIVSCEKTQSTDRWGYKTTVFSITLDNGKQVQLADANDCCAYTTLNNFLLHPESVDHVILGIGTTEKYSVWHVYADFGDILALDVGWSCGNPFYYGYGFDIQVIDPNAPKETIFDSAVEINWSAPNA